MPNEMSFSGPYVQAALLCEKMLIEAENIPSFVRVVDKFTVPKISGPIPPGTIVQPLQFTLVVMLKSGDLGSGRHDVKIKLKKPDQTYAHEVAASVFFAGSDDHGAIIAYPVGIASPQEGLHWFEVEFEGVGIITRIPMRVVFQPTVLSNLPPAAPEER